MSIRLPFSWNIVSVLTVSMVLMIALLFAMNSVLNIRRERAIFREQLESEALLIARLSSASVGDALDSRTIRIWAVSVSDVKLIHLIQMSQLPFLVL